MRPHRSCAPDSYAIRVKTDRRTRPARTRASHSASANGVTVGEPVGASFEQFPHFVSVTLDAIASGKTDPMTGSRTGARTQSPEGTACDNA